MLAKFLAVEEAISIAPHSTAEVKLQDADLSNVGFIFPTTESAARGLILANAGLLLGPAKAFVYNSKDVTQNIARGECIAINVKLEEEGLMMGELQGNDSESEATESETNESSAEAPTESAEEEAPVNPDEITDPMEGSDSNETEEASEVEETPAENDSSEAESETEETPEEEPVKKSTRSRK